MLICYACLSGEGFRNGKESHIDGNEILPAFKGERQTSNQPTISVLFLNKLLSLRSINNRHLGRVSHYRVRQTIVCGQTDKLLHAREKTNKQLKQSDTPLQCRISRWRKITLKQNILSYHCLQWQIFLISIRLFFMTQTIGFGQVHVADDCKEFISLRSINKRHLGCVFRIACPSL